MRTVKQPTANQDLISKGKLVARYACPAHQLEYVIPVNDKAECPACRQATIANDLRSALQEANNRTKIMERELDALRAKVESAYAMASCMDLLDDQDRVFLKAVLYRWRSDKGVQLRVTHLPAKSRRDKPAANGFIAMYRNADPVGHECTSIGGVAIAGYFEESQRALGDAQAMAMLARAANELLQGGLR